MVFLWQFSSSGCWCIIARASVFSKYWGGSQLGSSVIDTCLPEPGAVSGMWFSTRCPVCWRALRLLPPTAQFIMILYSPFLSSSDGLVFPKLEMYGSVLLFPEGLCAALERAIKHVQWLSLSLVSWSSWTHLIKMLCFALGMCAHRALNTHTQNLSSLHWFSPVWTKWKSSAEI